MSSKTYFLILFVMQINSDAMAIDIKSGLRKKIDLKINSEDRKTQFEIDFEINEFNRDDFVSNVLKSRMLGTFISTEMDVSSDPERQIIDRSKELSFISKQLQLQSKLIDFKSVEIKKVELLKEPTTSFIETSRLYFNQYSKLKDTIRALEKNLSLGDPSSLEEMYKIQALIQRRMASENSTEFRDLIEIFENVKARHFVDGIYKAKNMTIPKFKTNKEQLGGKLVRGSLNRCLLKPGCDRNELVVMLVIIEAFQCNLAREVYSIYGSDRPDKKTQIISMIQNFDTIKSWTAKIQDLEEKSREEQFNMEIDEVARTYELDILQSNLLKEIAGNIMTRKS